MHRQIEHSAFVKRGFTEICHILEHHAVMMLEDATTAASAHTAALVRGAEEQFPRFDSAEPLVVIVEDPGHDGDQHAWIEFGWTADRDKRLLASVECRLDVHPFVQTCPPTSELVLRAQYDPPPGTRHAPETILFGRRIVKAALHRLLDEIVDCIEAYKPSVRSLIHVPTGHPRHHPSHPRPDRDAPMAASVAASHSMPESRVRGSSRPVAAGDRGWLSTARLFATSDTDPPDEDPTHFRSVLFVALGARPDPPAAFHEAVGLAASSGATFTAFGVAPEPPVVQRAIHRHHWKRNLSDLLTSDLTSRLDSWGQGSAHPIDTRAVVGSPPVEVVREVIGSGHDLVVVPAPADDDLATVRHLIRLCPCPVWVPRRGFGGARVLAAVDPDDDPALNGLILDLARSQARKQDGELHVVHAWTTPGLAMLAANELAAVSPSLLGAVSVETETAHRDAFHDLLNGAAAEGECHPHLVHAEPARAIEDLVESRDIDLLVMGSAGRGGLAGVLVGNTAEQLLDRVRCSLLVVKPPGFISPLPA